MKKVNTNIELSFELVIVRTLYSLCQVLKQNGLFNKSLIQSMDELTEFEKTEFEHATIK